MRALVHSALVAILSAPAFSADLMITQTKHTDAMKFNGHEVRPAQDGKETMWIGKDRMRMESDDKITIIRMDQKKLYLLDPKAKTVSTLDLPVDMKKYVPEDKADQYQEMMSKTKVTLTPTTETKKIKDWNATKYTMTMTMPLPPQMGGEVSFNSDIWATKDIPVDRAAMNDMYGALMTMSPGGPALATEMKKIEGMPVLIERTQSMMGNEMKSNEEVDSVTSKDAPEGTYEVPKEYTEKKFDPTNGPMGGGPSPRRGRPADAGGDPHKGDKGGEKGGQKGGG
jgi:hypothetical protein